MINAIVILSANLKAFPPYDDRIQTMQGWTITNVTDEGKDVHRVATRGNSPPIRFTNDLISELLYVATLGVRGTVETCGPSSTHTLYELTDGGVEISKQKEPVWEYKRTVRETSYLMHSYTKPSDEKLCCKCNANPSNDLYALTKTDEYQELLGEINAGRGMCPLCMLKELVSDGYAIKRITKVPEQYGEE